MNHPAIRLLQQRKHICHQISQCREVIQGSAVLIRRTCGKSNCRCQKGFKHPSVYLSQRLQAKTRMTYIPARCQDKVLRGISQHKKMKRLVRRLSSVNERIILKGKDES